MNSRFNVWMTLPKSPARPSRVVSPPVLPISAISSSQKWIELLCSASQQQLICVFVEEINDSRRNEQLEARASTLINASHCSHDRLLFARVTGSAASWSEDVQSILDSCEVDAGQLPQLAVISNMHVVLTLTLDELSDRAGGPRAIESLFASQLVPTSPLSISRSASPSLSASSSSAASAGGPISLPPASISPAASVLAALYPFVCSLPFLFPLSNLFNIVRRYGMGGPCLLCVKDCSRCPSPPPSLWRRLPPLSRIMTRASLLPVPSPPPPPPRPPASWWSSSSSAPPLIHRPMLSQKQ